MTIVNVGVSHRITPAEVLERLAVPAAELAGALARLHAVPGIDEVAVLSTCNRVEVYAAVSGPAGYVTQAVADLMAARGSAQAGEVLRLARTRVGGAAAEHLFSVACGLDSMASTGPAGSISANDQRRKKEARHCDRSHDAGLGHVR